MIFHVLVPKYLPASPTFDLNDEQKGWPFSQFAVGPKLYLDISLFLTRQI